MTFAFTVTSPPPNGESSQRSCSRMSRTCNGSRHRHPHIQIQPSTAGIADCLDGSSSAPHGYLLTHRAASPIFGDLHDSALFCAEFEMHPNLHRRSLGAACINVVEPENSPDFEDEERARRTRTMLRHTHQTGRNLTSMDPPFDP